MVNPKDIPHGCRCAVCGDEFSQLHDEEVERLKLALQHNEMIRQKEKKNALLQVEEHRKALEEISEFQGSAPQAARIALEALTVKRNKEPQTIEDLLGECRECNRLMRDCGNHGPVQS